MPLSTFVIQSVVPRGGPAGTQFTITGAGFGVAQGAITFDPLASSLPAVIVSWADDAIIATVPIGVLANRFATLAAVKFGGSDGASVPWWVPADEPGEGDGLDYQYPDFEAGTAAENTDDPLRVQACDVNRLIDRAAVGASFKARHYVNPLPFTIPDVDFEHGKILLASFGPLLPPVTPDVFLPTVVGAGVHDGDSIVVRCDATAVTVKTTDGKLFQGGPGDAVPAFSNIQFQSPYMAVWFTFSEYLDSWQVIATLHNGDTFGGA